MDVHVLRAITVQLRVRGVDVLTAQEDGAGRLPDVELLTRATELDRVLFTRDDDLLREGNLRQQSGEEFAGVIYAHQQRVTIGKCVTDLEIIAQASEPVDMRSRVEHLPL